MPAPELEERLARLYAGRPVVLGPGVLAGWTRWTTWLGELGCPTLVLATGRGAGPVPGPGTQVVEVEIPATALVTDELRLHDRLLHHLPEPAAAAVEAFDPERRGVVLASPFVSTDEPVLGRPVTGGRPRAWLALEDKLRADATWAAVGLPAAPSRIVDLDEDDLAAATRELSGPLGAVWAGDARDGFNGAGNYVRWVRDDRDARTARAFFAPRCDRVRVMPFLDGVPCSIHGIVLPDGTAVLRPVEIAVLRNSAHRTFVYAGLGTSWDPPAADRAVMRAAARRVGEHLRAEHGYRGAFGIDGVLTADGFLPTELNTRMSAGATTAAEVAPRFFALLQANLVAGVDTGVTVADVEALVPRMDAERAGKVVAIGEGMRVGGAYSYPVDFDGTAFRRSGHETGNVLEIADTPTGFFARVEPCVALAPGRRLAEVTAALLRFVDAEYGAGFGPLEVPPDLRA
ncbi:hypothetical protein [Nocardioides sp.]|uniref:hypothetical protein n=1 Tax=Nocardioides sp. TaxID=35761 RepID=UPI0037849FA8